MPPEVGDHAPAFEALCCDGETFRPTSLTDAVGDRGAVFVFDGFVFSAIARNWWPRYEAYGWNEFDAVPVYGVVRDGPYSVNEFLRQLESPFSIFSDLNGDVAAAYDLLVERDGMVGTKTPQRAVFVLNSEGVVTERWLADDWIRPVPHEDIEAAVERL
ncbi:peroxiredoxin domain protein [Natronomonas pharaonis DSM 2160]|uniref:Peroxiredoxin domain protein n=1 Tax=Natronomonas pharaonis (strain ATCC 35678 / DSM 2160 / CIP 103997 / JCM 8858 / NBRC 14720 / NCIMB 2260 / Gabara) TaxID=348780 RepID=A0A1U7EYB8_NATPD|nr:peroxiredoxin family protein [Natronomonas pharaonis]CAI50200.1 peroxiredoxin domain protein [Natronomonas pharaonis DSM 2160]